MKILDIIEIGLVFAGLILIIAGWAQTRFRFIAQRLERGQRVLLALVREVAELDEPAGEDEVAPLYLRQLAIYRAALAGIYPDREIRCAILWTQAPLLMPISSDKLAAHAP